MQRVTVDFFTDQKRRSRQALITVIAFLFIVNLTVLAIMPFISMIIGLAFPDIFLIAPPLSMMIAGLIVGGVAFWTMSKIAADGGAVAVELGGQKVEPGTNDPQQKRLLRIVEEVSLAANLPAKPDVYIIPDQTINAFASGVYLDASAVAATSGALEHLTDDELRAVMAHEFGHLRYGDTRDGSYLVAVSSGLHALYSLGRWLSKGLNKIYLFLAAIIASKPSYEVVYVRDGTVVSRTEVPSTRAGVSFGLMLILAPFWLAALFWRMIGFVGVVGARILYFVHSRRQEFRADLAAVQFTRHPQALVSAFEKILLARRPTPLAENPNYAALMIDYPLAASDMVAGYYSAKEWIVLKRGHYRSRGFWAKMGRLRVTLFGVFEWLWYKLLFLMRNIFSTHPDMLVRIRMIDPQYPRERYLALVRELALALRAEVG